MLTARRQKEANTFIDWLVLQGVDRAQATMKVQMFAETLIGRAPMKIEPHEAIVPIMTLYVTLYRETFKEAPLVGDKEYGLIARLLRQYGSRAVEDRLRLLWKIEDPFIRAQGFTVPVLYSNWNKLAAVQQTVTKRQVQSAPKDCRHRPVCANAEICTRTRLEALRHESS